MFGNNPVDLQHHHLFVPLEHPRTLVTSWVGFTTDPPGTFSSAPVKWAAQHHLFRTQLLSSLTKTRDRDDPWIHFRALESHARMYRPTGKVFWSKHGHLMPDGEPLI